MEKELKYLGTELYKHEEIEREIREENMKGSCVIGSLQGS